jgi:hypothetical protein
MRLCGKHFPSTYESDRQYRHLLFYRHLEGSVLEREHPWRVGRDDGLWEDAHRDALSQIIGHPLIGDVRRTGIVSVDEDVHLLEEDVEEPPPS